MNYPEDTTGIVLAGGKATRFGGILKECLPIHGQTTPVQKTVQKLHERCEKVVVVSNYEKIAEHARLLGSTCLYCITGGESNMMQGIYAALQLLPSEYYFLAMADTIVEFDFPKKLEHFMLGTFRTSEPKRFGCIEDGWIVDKDPYIETPAEAWGMLGFSDGVVALWEKKTPYDYSYAINHAIAIFDYKTFPICSYTDLASLEFYMEYLCQRT
jgi:hypothetical protein